MISIYREHPHNLKNFCQYSNVWSKKGDSFSSSTPLFFCQTATYKELMLNYVKESWKRKVQRRIYMFSRSVNFVIKHSIFYLEWDLFTALFVDKVSLFNQFLKITVYISSFWFNHRSTWAWPWKVKLRNNF